MSAPTTSAACDRLLELVIDHFVVDGLHDQSLRQIAAAIGSSHRMLLYHFGSRDGLLVAVGKAVEARTKAQLTELRAAIQKPGSAEATDEAIRQTWAMVSNPALGDFERLFFALYGRGLQGDEAMRPMMKENIDDWIEFRVPEAAAMGMDPQLARRHNRLGLAVVRGLLLDLLATGDADEVQSALEIFADFYRGAWWETSC
ncbi:MAG: TetR/AcrR family transcriptional regulator [Acidimicrobiales bacterium]